MTTKTTTTTTVSLRDSFHPHLVTTIHIDGETSLFDSALMTSSSASQAWQCALDIRYHLPPSVFVDRYQLNDTLLNTPFIVQGSHDLEAPLEHVGSQEETWMIVRGREEEMDASTTIQQRSPPYPMKDLIVDIPLHLRYQAPDDTLTHRTITIPWPQVGWLCQQTDPHSRAPTAASPPSLYSSLHHFSNKATHLNLLQDTTAFVWIPIPPSQQQQMTDAADAAAAPIDVTSQPATPPPPPPHVTLKVPVGKTTDAWIVQWGTILVIVLSSCWILNAIAVAVQKHRRHEAKGKRRKS
ncbi:PIG-X protein, partial [Absidia repens]